MNARKIGSCVFALLSIEQRCDFVFDLVFPVSFVLGVKSQLDYLQQGLPGIYTISLIYKDIISV